MENVFNLGRQQSRGLLTLRGEYTQMNPMQVSGELEFNTFYVSILLCSERKQRLKKSIFHLLRDNNKKYEFLDYFENF